MHICHFLYANGHPHPHPHRQHYHHHHHHNDNHCNQGPGLLPTIVLSLTNSTFHCRLHSLTLSSSSTTQQMLMTICGQYVSGNNIETWGLSLHLVPPGLPNQPCSIETLQKCKTALTVSMPVCPHSYLCPCMSLLQCPLVCVLVYILMCLCVLTTDGLMTSSPSCS